MLLPGKHKTFGQSFKISQFHAKAELGGIISSNSAIPFWLRTNQFGIVPNEAPLGLFQTSVWRDYVQRDSSTKTKHHFDWGFVANPVVRHTKSDKFGIVLPEAHFKIRYRNVEFFAGRRREIMGLGDSVLTSGFYAVSGNAMPIPKVQISTIGYVPIAFKGFFSMNAGFSHGWINTPPYMYGARLHQKYLYFRFGRTPSPVRIYAGINHQATWAGHSEQLKNHPELAIDGQLPDSWKLYKYLVLGYTPKNWYEKSGFTSFDSYRIGNHLGSYDAAIETNLNGNRLLLYHQHIFEDVSSLLSKNFPDGLWGANWQLQSGTPSGKFRLTRITLEFLTTKDQSGSQFYIPGSAYQGADNYFNHSQYMQGWSYKEIGIGTPFITPRKDMDNTRYVPARFFANNRVNMWYIGAQGKYKETLLLTLRSSYSRNFGLVGDALSPPRGQLSSLLSAQLFMKKWYGTTLLANLSVDKGQLFPDSYGGYLGIRKSW